MHAALMEEGAFDADALEGELDGFEEQDAFEEEDALAEDRLVLSGVRNSLAFNLFYLKSQGISGTGAVLPPALQFSQNNTQTGGGISFSHRLTGMTNLTASATYSTTTSNTTEGLIADAR